MSLSGYTKTAKCRLSTVHRGVAFEQRALNLLKEYFSMSLTRVGGRGDGGIDLLGWWWLPSIYTSAVSPSSTSSSPDTGLQQQRQLRIRVVGQCKAEKKKLGPNYVRELEGVMYRLRATARLHDRPAQPQLDSSPSEQLELPPNTSISTPPTSPEDVFDPSVNEEDTGQDPNSMIAVLVSESGFTKATILQAYSSDIPFLLLWLPPPALPTLTPLGSTVVEMTPSDSTPDPQEEELGTIGTMLPNPALTNMPSLKGQIDFRWEHDTASVGLGGPELWLKTRRMRGTLPAEGTGVSSR
ncbi:hypothetical protein D9611_012935 [Ephemerocybe angulata]|uniref:Uncharacterized protein n=1 Tax=Ephemerocybe angulata TaxID=980116 RepID=A0A8H5C573_9AGAR|nr:hypothetical protein D9611_012935 [Tulosesus angulatus]